ncbi:MAG: glycine--tRNA ligase subunit beta, partial [Novosphingobium sp.]
AKLQAMQMTELNTMAKELGVEYFGTMRKHEVIFHVLQKNAERAGVLFAITEKPGRATAEVLAEAIPAIVRAFPWPKSQRWGAASISTESPRWVRPLSAIVALFDGQVVDCEVGGIKAGRLTKGHRFHSSGEISVDGVDDYADKLRAAHVIVDHVERQDLIRSKASEAAAAVGLKLVEDEGLVIENAGLTEWPVPLLGRFDEQFLEVPPEVIQLTARTNQKYFVCEDAAGKLANAFVCTANIAAADGGAAIVAGNRKVLAARLSDARFFWEQDRKTALSDHAKKLERITFHEKLGTVADTVERVAKLARWLEENRSLPGCEEAELAEQAARLCKADLVTEMVGEFPELQGLMGGYYARAEGLPDAGADAIRDHYKPVGQGDEVPTDPVTVAVALADKLDSLFSFFAYQLVPTGSKDPFALRRAAIGALSIIQSNQIRLKYFEAFEVISPLLPVPTGSARGLALIEYPPFGKVDVQAVALLNFIIDRLKVQQREAGVRHDLIDAVFALGGEDDLVRLLARVHALQAFVGTEDGANLLAGYKRAANILKKEDFTGGEEIALSYTPEPAERALVDALAEAGPRAAAAVAGEDFARAMAALASLRAPIDAFFEQVTVNDADPAKRTFRLNLLARLRDAVHGVADFSKIEG